MRRALVFVVIAAVGASSCAARSSHAIGPAPTTLGQITASPETMRRYVEKLPVGATVKLQLVSGQRMKAVLMVVEPTQIVVREKTRIPEPARTVALSDIAIIEPVNGGTSVGKAVAIGVATGAGTFLAILFWLIAIGD